VNRSFLYHHRDLHATILAKAAEPPTTPTGGPAVSRASLIADLGNAHDRIARLTTENQHLRNRLSEALGEQVWKETGLGGPTDIQQLQRRITELEQQPSTSAGNCPNATPNSTPPAPPTATSCPASTRPPQAARRRHDHECRVSDEPSGRAWRDLHQLR
jgi:hypothetical protein